MAKANKGPCASGTHARETFVRVFFAVFRSQHSGILDVQFGKRSRTLFFIGGRPISYRSDLPEDDLGRTLSNANLIPEKQVKWIQEKLSEDENLEQAIVMSGALTAAQIAEHKRQRLQASIGSPLQWGSGDWSFAPRATIQPNRIDPALRPDTGSMAALWHAVQQHVSMDAVFPQVTDPAAGMVALDPLCPALFSRLKVEEAFAGLPDAVGDGCSVEEIFRQVPDGSGNLVKLLWFLEAAGLIHRQGRPQDFSLDAQLKAIADAPQPKPKTGKTPTANKAEPAPAHSPSAKSKESELTEDTPSAESGEGQKKRRPPLTDDQLKAAHRKRIGLDFYAFIGVPPRAPKAAVDRKCKGLARRWRLPGKHRDLPDDVKAKVDELLAGVQLVWRTLTDDAHREEYDKRMGQGRAPKVGDLRVASAASVQAGGTPVPDNNTGLGEQHSKARQQMDKGDFKSALSLLKQARVDDPSSPDIMADLGWATWNLQGTKNGDAEEFLRLALTFDSNHLAGLEYLAKVLVEQNDLDTAKILIQRLVKLNPKSQWAKKALVNLDKGGK